MLNYDTLPEEVKVLILFDEMQKFEKDLTDYQKSANFALMKEEFIERNLLKELHDEFK